MRAAYDLEAHMHARIEHIAVHAGLAQLVRRQACAATTAVRQHTLAAVGHACLVKAREQIPHAFDIRIVVGHIRIGVVEPVADAFRQLLPVLLVTPDRLAAARVELGDAIGLDLRFAADAQLFLDAELDGQAVRVPAGLAHDILAFHRAEATHGVLDGAREHMVNARLAVGSRRSFPEHEARSILARRLQRFEYALLTPLGDELLF